jgi:alpha-mannosidase
MLNLALPLRLAAPWATAAAPYGWRPRPASGEEEPCQGWVDVSGDEGALGLTVLNDGQYGYDLMGNVFRQSLLRSPIYAFHDPRRRVPGVRYHYTDQGLHRFHLRLLPHAGDWNPAGAVRAAYAYKNRCWRGRGGADRERGIVQPVAAGGRHLSAGHSQAGRGRRRPVGARL